MRAIKVNGVVYESTAKGDESDCRGCVARGVQVLCDALNKQCAVDPQIFQIKEQPHLHTGGAFLTALEQQHEHGCK